MEINTESEWTVFLITGRAWDVEAQNADNAVPISVLLRAPDEDSAVFKSLTGLKQQGYLRAELDQIGPVVDAPDDPLLESAYQDALAGETVIVLLNSEPGDSQFEEFF